MVAYGFTQSQANGLVVQLANTDSQLQHMTHMLDGYRGFVTGECNPFSSNSASGNSWQDGWDQAKNDFETYHSDWTN